MEIELYYTPHTRSSRPRWLLEEIGVPYTVRPVDLFGGERNPVHPLGSVPAIRIDGEILIESGAICHWLADAFPEQHLAPANTDPRRSRYEQWMFFVPATLEPPAFEVLLHTQLLPENKRIEAIVPFATRGYQRVLRMLVKELDHDGYLLGEQFTCADIMLGTTLTWLPELLEDHPPLLAYIQRVTARPAYQRAIEPINETA
ncbi:MAG: glutathione S-transferase family protein [Pseudomonadota bacterium]